MDLISRRKAEVEQHLAAVQHELQRHGDEYRRLKAQQEAALSRLNAAQGYKQRIEKEIADLTALMAEEATEAAEAKEMDKD